MKQMVVIAFFIFYFSNCFAAHFGLPVIVKDSSYYYIPQLKLEKKGKFFNSSASYSGSGNEYVKSMSFFSGCGRCDWQNVILVNKKTGAKKPLLKENSKITTFLVTTENDSKSKLPQLILFSLKGDNENSPTEFYAANFDGTHLQRISPSGKSVISYDIDPQEKKLILLLKTNETSENASKEASPYIVDLQKISEAVPIL